MATPTMQRPTTPGSATYMRRPQSASAKSMAERIGAKMERDVVGPNTPRTIARPGTARSTRNITRVLTARPSSASASRPPTAQRRLVERPRTARQEIESRLDVMQTRKDMDMQARKAALDLLDADLDIADDDGGDDEILYVENKATVKSANEVRRLIQTNFTNIRPAFRRFDENHDMMLSVDELCRACNDQGIPLSVFEANRLLAQIDKDHSGAVSNYEFMRFFGEASDAGGLSAQLIAADDAKAARRVAIDQALEVENKHGFALEGTAADADAKLKKRIADNFKNVREAFRRFDADGDGMLSTEELCYACQSAGVKMNKDEADRLLIMVDNDGSGSVSNKEFMVYFGESADVGGLSSTLQKNNTAETAYKRQSDHLTKLAAPIDMDALGKVARAEMNEKESTAMISNIVFEGKTRNLYKIEGYLSEARRKFESHMDHNMVRIRDLYRDHLFRGDHSQITCCTHKEFRSMIKKSRVALTKDELEAVIIHLDGDKTGLINMTELEKFVALGHRSQRLYHDIRVKPPKKEVAKIKNPLLSDKDLFIHLDEPPTKDLMDMWSKIEEFLKADLASGGGMMKAKRVFCSKFEVGSGALANGEVDTPTWLNAFNAFGIHVDESLLACMRKRYAHPLGDNQFLWSYKVLETDLFHAKSYVKMSKEESASHTRPHNGSMSPEKIFVIIRNKLHNMVNSQKRHTPILRNIFSGLQKKELDGWGETTQFVCQDEFAVMLEMKLDLVLNQQELAALSARYGQAGFIPLNEFIQDVLPQHFIDDAASQFKKRQHTVVEKAGRKIENFEQIGHGAQSRTSAHVLELFHAKAAQMSVSPIRGISKMSQACLSLYDSKRAGVVTTKQLLHILNSALGLALKEPELLQVLAECSALLVNSESTEGTRVNYRVFFAYVTKTYQQKDHICTEGVNVLTTSEANKMKTREDISQRVIHERTLHDLLAEMRAQMHQKNMKFNDLARIVRYATLKQAQRQFSFEKQAEWEFKDAVDTQSSNANISASVVKHILNEQLGLDLTENENRTLVKKYKGVGDTMRIRDLFKDVADDTQPSSRKGRQPCLKNKIKERRATSGGARASNGSRNANASSIELTYYDPHAQQAQMFTNKPENPVVIEEVVKQPEVSSSQESLKVNENRVVEQAPGKPILAVGIPKVVSKAALKEMKDALNKLKGVLLRVMPKQFTMDDLFGFVDCKQKGIINKAALFRLFYKTHVKVKRRILDTMMDVYDRDRDGKLNFSEFSVAFNMSDATRTKRSTSRNQKRKAHEKIAHLYSELKEQTKAKQRSSGLSLTGTKML